MKDTFEQQTSKRCTIFPTPLSEDGQRKEKLDVPPVQNDSIVLETSKNISTEVKTALKKKKVESVMQESVAITKKKTSKDRLNNSNPNILNMKLSPTSDLDLIGKEKVLQKFWTKLSQERAKKLSLPTKTDYVDSDTNSLSRSAKKPTPNSWFSTNPTNIMPKKNCQKICSQSSPSSSQEIMDYVQERIKEKKPEKKTTEKILKVLKIQMFLTKDEKEILKNWMGACRWTYNMCLDGINKNLVEMKPTPLRQYCVNKDSELFKKNEWLGEIPADVRGDAMRDLLAAYKSCFAKKEMFKMRFKSKKSKKDSICIEKKHWERKTGVYAFLKHIKYAEKLPEIKHDIRIINDILDRYWICIPTELVIRSENQRPKSKVVAIDPGVRTFATTYDNDGDFSEWACGDDKKIKKLCIKYDQLQSKLNRNEFYRRGTKISDNYYQQERTEYYRTRKTRRNFKKMMLKIRDEIRNKVKDLHCKLAKYLCLNYNVILIPEFKTQSMIKKDDRKISSKTARAICTYSHYLFRQRLINKSREFPSCKVILVTEEYTSKTCGSCGEINETLGSSKEFKCPSCDYTADRDINAARNILLKFIS